MDWVRDNFGLSENNLNAVFKYRPRDSTVVQILQGRKVRTTASIEEARASSRTNGTS